MPAHRTKPDYCMVPGCYRRADTKGTARGWCSAHYTRWRRYGWCQAMPSCASLAVSHLGLCGDHTPAGVLA